MEGGYTYKGCETGFQLESYGPAVDGYPSEREGSKFINYYAGWAKDNFTVIAGSFYEQLGSGLLFSSWEDRTLGFNNAMMGAKFSYNFNNYINVKGMWGAPRLGLEYSETQTRAVDLSISTPDILSWKSTSLILEGSVLNHYESRPPVFVVS